MVCWCFSLFHTTFNFLCGFFTSLYSFSLSLLLLLLLNSSNSQMNTRLQQSSAVNMNIKRKKYNNNNKKFDIYLPERNIVTTITNNRYNNNIQLSNWWASRIEANGNRVLLSFIIHCADEKYWRKSAANDEQCSCSFCGLCIYNNHPFGRF